MGGVAIGECLASNSSLTVLRLGRNCLEDSSFVAFGKSLETNTTLLVLDLSYNNNIKDGVKAIEECLLVNSTLTELHLGIFAGDSILHKVLPRNSSLLSLSLSVQNLVTAIPPLEQNTTIIKLKFASGLCSPNFLGLYEITSRKISDLLHRNRGKISQKIRATFQLYPFVRFMGAENSGILSHLPLEMVYHILHFLSNEELSFMQISSAVRYGMNRNNLGMRKETLVARIWGIGIVSHLSTLSI